MAVVKMKRVERRAFVVPATAKECEGQPLSLLMNIATEESQPLLSGEWQIEEVTD
jgi:hypothetical protein